LCWFSAIEFLRLGHTELSVGFWSKTMGHGLSTLAISFLLAVPPASVQAAPDLATRMDRAATFYQHRDGFTGIVAVARDHKTIFLHGYGYANLKSKIPFTADTRFRIGSLTKQFTAAARRSEVRGLKWCDLDFNRQWFNLRRGMVRKDETNLKTQASRKGVPMLPELAEMLTAWRKETPYPKDEDWVFASPFTNGERPYWPESAMKNHVRPAAHSAGIRDKVIGWHTFRHSVGTLLGQKGEDLKTVQELLRHANSRITADIYQQGNTAKKRNALSNMSGIFVVPPMAKAS